MDEDGAEFLVLLDLDFLLDGLVDLAQHATEGCTVYADAILFLGIPFGIHGV